VSLVGPGGVGNTRLAIEVARRCSLAHVDGWRFIDLSTLGEARDVPAALASGLGFSLAQTSPNQDPVVHHLGDKQILLDVDNCEHVLAAIAACIEHLLTACSN
jgi:predicted ATPase